MSKNLTNLSARKGLQNNIFERLQLAAAKDGVPDNKKIKEISEEFLYGEANILGTSSFYDFLKDENREKKANVCNGSACLVAGTQNSIHSKLESLLGVGTIGEACCLGRCHENSAFQLNGTNYSGKDIEQITNDKKSLQNLKSNEVIYSSAFCKPPVLLRDIADIDAIYFEYNKLTARSAIDLLELLKASKLRGRGGAGYMLGAKLEACLNAKSNEKYIVCNADEGDPGSYTDRYLLLHKPHLILLGMLINGLICGANTGIIYIRAEYPEAISVVQKAIDEFRQQKSKFGNAWTFDFKIIRGAGSYICGEETALLSSIEGQRPEVRIRPPFPTEYGLFGKPTLINNVETLANIPFIMKYGVEEYCKHGTDDSKGTKLICLDRFFNRPGVYEVPFGMGLREIIESVGRGFTTKVKALQIGGPLGGVIPSSQWDKLTFDFESFHEAGFLLGHGSFISIPQDFSMMKYMEHLFSFTTRESCGKCFPCRIGSQRGMELLQASLSKKRKIESTLFNDLLETMSHGSLCGLGAGLPLPIRNILNYFGEEIHPFFHHESTIDQ